MPIVFAKMVQEGDRRTGAELRHRGGVVNGKTVERLIQPHDLNPHRRRRVIRATDSGHDGPIYPLASIEALSIEAHNQSTFPAWFNRSSSIR